VNSHRRPHMSQQDRDALEDLGLVDHYDRTDSHELTAFHVEAVMAS
jgi:hypothetical protein